MMRLAITTLFLFVMGCGPAASPLASPGTGSDGGLGPGSAAPQKPLVMALAIEPATLDATFMSGANGQDYVVLTTGFLAYVNPDEQPAPYLAEVLPTLENGAWKLLPDGRMETTYVLKRAAKWHDGRPIVAADYLFAHQIRMDPALPVMDNQADLRVAAMRAVDEYALVIEWKEPYIWAGSVHATELAPNPRHRLEAMYRDDKEGFINGPHWRDQYVSSGPYKLERWDPGNEMVFRAFDGFVFGKPPIDEIRIKFIQDPNTVVANLLSGSLDVAFFSAIGFPQNVALEQAGWQGATEYWSGSSRFVEFQQRDWGNLQRAVLDVRVRRGVLHAIDRQSIGEAVFNGKAPLYHFWLHARNPAYPVADRAVTKYEYDPQRAVALLSEAGWTRGGDGVARNTAGQALFLPLLAQTGDIENRQSALLMDSWKTVGIASDLIPVTPQLQRDGEFRSKYPAVAYNRRGFGLEQMVWTKEQLTLPERRWAGQNRNGYVNPLLDEFWGKAIGTIDAKEREALLVNALKVMTEDAVVTPLLLEPRAVAYRHGLVGPREPWVEANATLWNVWEWRWT